MYGESCNTGGILELLQLPSCNQCSEAAELYSRSSLHRHFSVRTRNVWVWLECCCSTNPLVLVPGNAEHPEYQLSGSLSP